jgi:hypothetical protein
MLAFHVCLHARPSAASAVSNFELAGRPSATLAMRPADLPPFGVSFEQAATALAALPRMYCEPDGSFVWTSPTGEPAWQVDGNLYDRGGRLLYVDLKGSCPGAELDRLLTTCGWPGTPVIFQLVREAVFLDEETFRRYAAQG